MGTNTYTGDWDYLTVTIEVLLSAEAMGSFASLFEASTQAPLDKIDYQVRNDGIKQVDV
jgi:hypothetical protein